MIRTLAARYVAAVFALFVISCGGTSDSTKPPSSADHVPDQFADLVDDERETVLIAPADLDVASYDIMPASFDTVIVRAEHASGDQDRSVDVLLKGSFPDGCTQLHEISQQSTPDGVSVSLTMRRPSAAMCTQVVRPYRYFFVLDELFSPGTYTLTVNNRSFPFRVG